MNIVIHAEVIVVGALTGSLIGFFWHPVGAVAALAMGAMLVVGASDGRRAGGRS
jgi:hypothetical protein